VQVLATVGCGVLLASSSLATGREAAQRGEGRHREKGGRSVPRQQRLSDAKDTDGQLDVAEVVQSYEVGSHSLTYRIVMHRRVDRDALHSGSIKLRFDIDPDGEFERVLTIRCDPDEPRCDVDGELRGVNGRTWRVDAFATSRYGFKTRVRPSMLADTKWYSLVASTRYRNDGGCSEGCVDRAPDERRMRDHIWPLCGAYPPTIVGSEGDDAIVGTERGDVILGRRGGDTIDGGDGFDVICGDGGRDELSGGRRPDQLHGGAGDDSLKGGTAHAICPVGDCAYPENLLFGGAGHDLLFGGRDSDHGIGNAGPDRIYGRGGTDRLEGGSGRDHIDGGRGDDRCRGEDTKRC
jgi:hypothetical protein